MKRRSKCLRLFALAIFGEWRGITTSPASLLVIVGGVVLYGFLYNLLYRPNVVREAPIVVVDESESHLSRKFSGLIDASPDGEVVAHIGSLLEGQAMLREGKAEALVYLPHNMSERVARGEGAIFVTLSSTATFLDYEATANAVLEAMLALDEGLRQGLVWTLPKELTLALSERQTAEVVGTAFFNPTKGYADYLIPVVFVIIIFQTMVMVTSMNSGSRCERRTSLLRGQRVRLGASLTITLARSALYCTIYGLLAVFLVGLLPRIFNLPHLASARDLIVLMTPFMLATSLFGQAFGRLFPDRDSPLLFVTFFSVGLIFLSGISFPLELLPAGWRIAHYLFPAAPATLAFVELGSMGATLSDIAPQLTTLWSQAALYLLLATLPSRGFR